MIALRYKFALSSVCSSYAGLPVAKGSLTTQKAMDMGLFEVKETVVIHNGGLTKVMKTPKITGLGQQYFVNLFLEN